MTYNGRGFDWPLLVARYRLARRAAPSHDGHLDLLPIVRRLFRHRMADARLRTAEAALLGLHRVGDVEGWEIPSRYLGFLRGGPADALVDVVRHNDQDVRSLARLLVHLETRLGDTAARPKPRRATWPVWPGRSPASTASARRSTASTSPSSGASRSPSRSPRSGSPPARRPPWPRGPVVVAASAGRLRWTPGASRRHRWHAPDRGLRCAWTTERIAIDRAHLLRRLGRYAEAAEAWEAIAAGTGRSAIVAAIELAKLHEHRLRDRPGRARRRPPRLLADRTAATDRAAGARARGRPGPSPRSAAAAQALGLVRRSIA